MTTTILTQDQVDVESVSTSPRSKRSKERSRLQRRLSALVASFLVVAAGFIGFGAAQASASAYTCAFGANITVFNLPTIPTVQFCNGINGSGTWVDNTYGSFLTPGVICNYSITSEFFDSS